MTESMMTTGDHAPRGEGLGLQQKSGRDQKRLTSLAGMASLPIETSLVGDLSGNLHSLFDHVCDRALPIYFGPLLGRLYLEGL